MHIIDQQLKKRDDNNNPIKVGIIGAGEMAKGLMNQINHYMPGMIVQGIYNRSLPNAEKMCIATGSREYIIAKKPQDIEEAFQRKKPAITSDLDLLLESKFIDVVVELTGQISFGLEAILKAFKKGKHVVSFNAELEATLGPYIKDQALKHGVKYTLGDGDQPGVTLNLWRHVKMMGFEPLLCGNIKGLQDHYRNPTTQASFAAKWEMTPEMVTSFADGTKISFEQACIANATDMTIAQRGMMGINSDKHIDDLTGEYNIEQLKSLGGIVDYVVGAKPGPGVFIYAATEDPISIKYLSYGKLGDGPLYSFYIPYHLLFFELAFSIARLIDYDDITLDAEFGLKVEVVALAKEPLKAGDSIDGLGGYKTYGVCETSDIVQKEKFLPMGLAEGCVLKKDLPRDAVITLNDVEFSQDLLKFKCYRDQVNNR